jgi:hypothetical protein
VIDLPVQLGRMFSLDLSDAIEQGTATFLEQEPFRFNFDGADLAHAVEREAFVRLANDPSLLRAYREQGGPVRVLDSYEARVVQLLVPAAQPMLPWSIRTRSLARPAVRWARSHRRISETPVPSQDRPVCLVIGHPKFVRFAMPIIAELGAERVGILALSQDAAAASTSLSVPVSLLDQPSPLRSRRLPHRAHLADLYAAMHQHLRSTHARAVVVFEGNAPSDEVAGAAAHSLGVASVCIQHGWAPITNVGFRNMNHTRMMVWGDGFSDLLAPHNPDQRFVATGNPALDGYEVARFPSIGVEAERGVLFSLQTAAPTIPLKAMVSFLQLIEDAAESLPDIPLLVREHPGHPLADLGLSIPSASNVVDVDPRNTPLLEALDACFAVAAISSTTLLEGIALLRPALVVDELPYSPDVTQWNAGIQTNGRQAALEALVQLADPAVRAAMKPGMESFRDRFFAGASGDAAARIASAIDDVL